MTLKPAQFWHPVVGGVNRFGRGPTPEPTPDPDPDTTGQRTFTTLPSQPFSVSYGDNPTTALTGSHARPGGLVIASRGNYNDQVFKNVSAAGGTVLLYIDAIIDNKIGRYHQLLDNASAYGPAVPSWPGPISANSSGNLNDFRPGSVMHQPSYTNPAWTKLEAVLELAVSENPHLGGLFADDVGSRSWFPNINWDTFGSTAQQSYRAGAILVMQAFRRVCNRHGIISIVNGTFQAGSLAANGGGYPNMSIHGASIADGGTWEHHTKDAFGQAYMTGAQWATDSPVGDKMVNMIISNSESDRASWAADNAYAYVNNQSDYDEVGTNGLPGHFNGLPTKVDY